MKQVYSLRVSSSTALRGTLWLPGDKSLSHRAALLGALAVGESVIERFLVSGVTTAMLQALAVLGIKWSLQGERLVIQGRGLDDFGVPGQVLNCGNSATTMRLLVGALVASGTACTLDGSAGLRKRPMARVTAPLQAMGAQLTTSADGCAPLVLAGRASGEKLRAAAHTLAVASAQVKSALILAALAADGVTTIHEPGPSRDHTERMLTAMGAEIEYATGVARVQPLTRPLRPLCLTLPGDISSATFLMVAALLVPGSVIVLSDIGLNPTRTGIIEALRAMGGEIVVSNERMVAGEPVGDLTVRAAPLHGVAIAGDLVVRMIDEFPAFAVAACYATGVTQVRQAQELRYKETDRIACLCHELRQLGVQVVEYPDGFDITGKTIQGGVCQARGDHRLAMSLALAGLMTPKPVQVEGAEILAESYPEFSVHLRQLGAIVQMED